MNDAEVAGQTIFHYHVHLIPRRKGDTDNPCGGIRGVIEGKSKYLVPIKPNHLIIFITLFNYLLLYLNTTKRKNNIIIKKIYKKFLISRLKSIKPYVYNKKLKEDKILIY